MDIVETLKELHAANVQYKRLLQSYDEVKKDMYVIQGVRYDTPKVTGGRARDISDKAARMDELARQILDIRDTMFTLEEAVTPYLEKLPSKYSFVMYERYSMGGNDWYTVADHVGCHLTYAHRIHKKALAMLEQMTKANESQEFTAVTE